jgi:hypothetical protein
MRSHNSIELLDALQVIAETIDNDVKIRPDNEELKLAAQSGNSAAIELQQSETTGDGRRRYPTSLLWRREHRHRAQTILEYFKRQYIICAATARKNQFWQLPSDAKNVTQLSFSSRVNKTSPMEAVAIYPST